MGFLTEKYSRIIKAPSWMYFKESREIKAVVRKLRLLYQMVYEVLPEEVEKQHRIKKSLKDQERAIGLAKDVADAVAKFDVNIEVQEVQVLGIIRKIENEWKRIRESIPRTERMEVAKELRNIDESFRYIMQQVMKEAEKEDKILYQYVMNLITAAGEEDRVRTFMQNLRTYFKTLKPSQLARWAGKLEARELKIHYKNTEWEKAEITHIANELEELIKGKGRKKGEDRDTFVKKNFDIIVKRLHELIVAMRKNISKMFLEAYLAIKRGLMLCFMLLNYLDDLEANINIWLAKKEEPTAPEQEIKRKITKAKAHIKERAQVISQGLRIIFHQENALEKF